MRRLLSCVALSGALLTSGCSRDEADRRALLEDAQRNNVTIARGAVVRDLRAPSDTGRLTYDSAVSLRLQSGDSMRLSRVWAPFGMAQPDTTR